MIDCLSHSEHGIVKMKSFKQFMLEGNPTTRMMTKAKTQQTGNIAADRGTDEKKNRESRKSLEKDLKKKGIGYKKGVGEYKVMRRLGRKHGQETVITKDKNKPARLHDTESKKPKPSGSLGKTTPGKHPKGYGETSGTKVRSGKLGKTNKPTYHYS